MITRREALKLPASRRCRCRTRGKLASSIWRVPVGGGTEERVADGLSYPLNFVVADCGLYFLAVGDAPDKTSIDLFEFATGERTRIVDLEKPWWYGMALSPDGKLLFSLVNSAGSNLMLVENFRGAPASNENTVVQLRASVARSGRLPRLQR